MKREELFTLVRTIRERKIKTHIRQEKDENLSGMMAEEGMRAAVQRELIAYFKSPQGQEALRRAPRVTVEFEPNFPLQEQPVERIVELVMQELD